MEYPLEHPLEGPLASITPCVEVVVDWARGGGGGDGKGDGVLIVCLSALLPGMVRLVRLVGSDGPACDDGQSGALDVGPPVTWL